MTSILSKLLGVKKSKSYIKGTTDGELYVDRKEFLNDKQVKNVISKVNASVQLEKKKAV